MIDSNEARSIAEARLRQLERDGGHELGLLEDSIREETFGWVYFYNSRKFIETGDFNWSLGGNAPFIVDKSSGDLHEAGTAHPIETYIRYFAEHRTLEGFMT